MYLKILDFAKKKLLCCIEFPILYYIPKCKEERKKIDELRHMVDYFHPKQKEVFLYINFS